MSAGREPVRVAILGAGIGREHLRGYLALPGRFEVVALCDLDEGRARAVLDEAASADASVANASSDTSMGVAADGRAGAAAAGAEGGRSAARSRSGVGAIRVERDVEAVIADDGIDLVDVCLPPALHVSTARAALEAGRHVVCEKPLVTSLAEADALLESARASGGRLFPVFQYRYGPATARLTALIEAGLAGRPFVASLETHWNRDRDYYAVPWRGTWAGENGGAVLGHAIHNHDLLTTVLGPIESVSAFVATRVNEIEVEDCAAIAFRMRSGAVASSSITLGAARDTTRLRFCFERLTVESGNAPYAPAEDAWTFTARDPSEQGRIDEVLASVAEPRCGFAGFFQAVADALAGDTARAVAAEDGRASIELVAAVYLAARRGCRVDLPLARGSELYEGWTPASLPG